MASPFTPSNPTGMPTWTKASVSSVTWVPTLQGVTQIVGTDFGLGDFGVGDFGVGVETTVFNARLATQWTVFTTR